MKVISTSKWLTMVAALFSGLFVCTEVERAAHASEPAEKLQFVAELEGVEEIKLLGTNPTWTKDDDKQFAADIAAARDAWKTEAAKIQEKLTPKKGCARCRAAPNRKWRYNTAAPLDRIKISAIGMTADKKNIVFESTIDTLPRTVR